MDTRLLRPVVCLREVCIASALLEGKETPGALRQARNETILLLVNAALVGLGDRSEPPAELLEEACFDPASDRRFRVRVSPHGLEAQALPGDLARLSDRIFLAGVPVQVVLEDPVCGDLAAIECLVALDARAWLDGEGHGQLVTWGETGFLSVPLVGRHAAEAVAIIRQGIIAASPSPRAVLS